MSNMQQQILNIFDGVTELSHLVSTLDLHQSARLEEGCNVLRLGEPGVELSAQVGQLVPQPGVAAHLHADSSHVTNLE